MEPHELLERLVPLIPPPRAHQVRYHGVLASCASARDRVVPGPRPAPVGAKPSGPGTPTHRWDDAVARIEPEPSSSTAEPVDLELGADDTSERGDLRAPDPHDPRSEAAFGSSRPRRLPWAELLQRVFAVDALRCPRCGARMRLVAPIEDPDVARKILACLDLPARAPPLAPAPSPSAWDEDEPSGGEPAWDLDPSAPDDDGIG
jgi:hypothetical protein